MLIVDEWMTAFYGKKWFLVNSPNFEVEGIEKGVYEWRIEATEYENLQRAINIGFELVETDVEFETEIFSDTTALPDYIREGRAEDLDAILELVDVCFIQNKKFYNRLKNRRYFTVKQCEEYFRKSVVNNFDKHNTVATVAVKGGEVIGYYIIKRTSKERYKVVSTGVHPSMWGNNIHIDLQKKLTDIIKKPYILINRTQLGNYPVIQNHMKENRKLTKFEYILYLDKS